MRDGTRASRLIAAATTAVGVIVAIASVAPQGQPNPQATPKSVLDGAFTAAQAAGVSTLYSEDFSHGQFYGSVRVVNPFQ